MKIYKMFLISIQVSNVTSRDEMLNLIWKQFSSISSLPLNDTNLIRAFFYHHGSKYI